MFLTCLHMSAGLQYSSPCGWFQTTCMGLCRLWPFVLITGTAQGHAKTAEGVASRAAESTEAQVKPTWKMSCESIMLSGLYRVMEPGLPGILLVT